MVPLVDTDVIEKGRVGPGENIAVDLVDGPLLPRPELKDHLAALKPYSRWMENITHLDERTQARPFSPDAVRARRAAPPPGALRAHHRGHGADPLAHGARRQGGGGLDGRRHAPGRALQALSRPAPLLPPAVQPGHQPADRPVARMAGDEPEDPLRQSRQRLRRGPEPDPDPAAREPGPDLQRGRGGQGPFRHEPAHHRLHLRRRPRGPPARRRSSASARRPRRPCAAAARR